MHGKKNNCNMDELFKNSKIIWFPDMINQEQQLGYKISHRLLPSPIHQLFDE